MNYAFILLFALYSLHVIPVTSAAQKQYDSIERGASLSVSPLHYCLPRAPIQGNKTPPTKTMTMFFDDSERGINTAITIPLAMALYQIECSDSCDFSYSILTSASLLQSIVIARKFGTHIYEDLKQQLTQAIAEVSADNNLSADFNKTLRATEKVKVYLTSNDVFGRERTPIIGSFIASQLAIHMFKPEHWQIYEVNEGLYLLMPDRPFDKKEKLTDFETGLKLSTLTKVSYAELEKKMIPAGSTSIKEALQQAEPPIK